MTFQQGYMGDSEGVLPRKTPSLSSSNSWIKGGKLSKFKFEWQKGYGAFTHSRSQIDTVAKYILTQEEHHKAMPFKEEYLGMLVKNNIEFKEEYLFEFINDIHNWD